MTTRKIILALLLSLTFSLHPAVTLAGAGHDHGESQFSSGNASGALTLEKSTINNLDIQTVEAQIKPMAETVRMLAQIKLMPAQKAIVTPRFEGRVDTVYAKLGESIEEGQKLARIDPLSVGSDPVTVKAPADGVLSQQNVITGQIVRPGDVMMQVDNRSEVLAKGITYEIDRFNEIRTGQSVKLRLDALPGRVFQGTVQRIDQAVNEDNRTFAVYALIPNKDRHLIPHMQGSMTIATGEGMSVLSVPQKAVLGGMGQHFVYVRDGNHFEKRSVTLGMKKGELREIISGVFPGDKVVIQGNYQLQYITPDKPTRETPQGHGHDH